MTDIKKIAFDVREAGRWIDDTCGEPTEIGTELREHADALDALAAQSEPVAWQDKGDTDYILSDSQFDRRCRDANDYRPLYAAPQPAPQPAPPQPAVPESFEKALERFSVSVNRRTYGLDSEAVLAEARAEVLRLYALAAVAAVTWQPIETAPKDGTVILGWPIYGHAGPREIQWRAWAIVEGQEECWIVCNAAKSKQEVTHWMPLPAAPEAGS